MKVITTGSLVLIGLLAGCATHTPLQLPGAVGPESARPVAETTNGKLIVFSAEETGPNSAAFFDDVVFCADYDLLDRDGHRLQRVKNSVDRFSTAPATVELPPGSYRVVAPANGVGLVSVNVVIAAHQTTVVHLDGQPSFGTPRPVADDRAVRLPDGRIVGWRDDHALASAPAR